MFADRLAGLFAYDRELAALRNDPEYRLGLAAWKRDSRLDLGTHPVVLGIWARLLAVQVVNREVRLASLPPLNQLERGRHAR